MTSDPDRIFIERYPLQQALEARGVTCTAGGRLSYQDKRVGDLHIGGLEADGIFVPAADPRVNGQLEIYNHLSPDIGTAVRAALDASIAEILARREAENQYKNESPGMSVLASLTEKSGQAINRLIARVRSWLPGQAVLEQDLADAE